MRRFHQFCLASAMLAAVLTSSSQAQPPERGGQDGRGRPEGRERAEDRPEGRRGGEDRPEGRGGPQGRGDAEGRRGGGPPGDMMRMLPLMAALDADQDGKISKQEIDNASAALRKLDKNNDGALTEDELRPNFAGFGGPGGPGRGPGGPGGPRGPEGAGGPGGNPAEFMARMFESRDANKDGVLSGDEIPEQMAGRLERIDTNSDGKISREEMGAAMAQMRGRDGAGPRGGDRPGGDRPGGDRPRRPDAE